MQIFSGSFKTVKIVGQHIISALSNHMLKKFNNHSRRQLSYLIRSHKESPDNFFKMMRTYVNKPSVKAIIDFLRCKSTFKAALDHINYNTTDNYLYEQFVYWINAYARKDTSAPLIDFFSGTQTLNSVCKDFIKFCFSQNIMLDKTKTLYSFNYHNQLSDDVVKKELLSISPKKTLHLLGFGLDTGDYEKSLADFLITQNKAQHVYLYGFDPYAAHGEGIHYLTEKQLKNTNLQFDIVIARWVLHHIPLKQRWSDFIRCINRCHSQAMVLIIEHGFINNKSVLPIEKKFYHVLNAFFDIVANIGLRPHYFMHSMPEIGKNFFIDYLKPEDFSMIKRNVSINNITQSIYNIGPNFPHQTICCMRTYK